MARPSGFEPETAGTANQCSIQLSYGRIRFVGRNYISLLLKSTSSFFKSLSIFFSFSYNSEVFLI